MSDALISTLFQKMGVEVFNFIIDYKLPNGVDRYLPLQVPATCSKHEAVATIVDDYRRRGYEPHVVAYIPGSYSLAELSALAEGRLPPPAAVQLLFISRKAWKEAKGGNRQQRGKGKSGKPRGK